MESQKISSTYNFSNEIIIITIIILNDKPNNAFVKTKQIKKNSNASNLTKE